MDDKRRVCAECSASCRIFYYKLGFQSWCRIADIGWRSAEAGGKLPAIELLQHLADQIKELPYRVESKHIAKIGDCSHLSLHAIAKGCIADAAAQRACARPGIRSVVGFDVGGQDFSHVIDPRNGRPGASTASVTVVAKSAVTADALAVIAGILPPFEAMTLLASRPNNPACLIVEPACLIVGSDGTMHRNDAWVSIATP